MMLDLEGQWTDLLAANNIMSIIHGLRKITEDDKADVDETLSSFSCWLQRTSEFTKKELLSLCFSRCQGLWMFLNHYSFRRVHHLLLKLRNLLTLVQWARRKLHPGLYCHGYKDTSSNARRRSWIREHRDLKQHLWLGRLVEWWSLMGLLPKRSEVQGEKQISHMWKEMSQSHHKSGLADSECSTVIQGLVTHLVKQHGCLWTPESSGQQCYPPPSLKALLKLVLVPHVETQSVQAIIMYFILDITKVLQCRNDLFKSFCNSFTIPHMFSSQIKAFWMLDHGQIKTAVELLLSPRTALPQFSWQHHCIIKSLLLRKERQMALRYLCLTSPAMESVEDAKLSADVWLQNSCVSEAWTVVKRNNTENGDMVAHFLKACNEFGLRAEASKYIPPGYKVQSENYIEVASLHLTDPAPCPLSAALYRAQRERALSSEQLLRLFIQSVTALRSPPVCTLREFTWAQREQKEAKAESSEVFLSTEVQYLRSPSPSIVEPRSDDCNSTDNPDRHSFCTSPALVPTRRHVSFSSVSSLSPIRKDQTFSYESTVTLQQISALLIDDQGGDEEELSQVSLSAEVFPECSDRTLEGSAVPVIERSHSPHSFRSRFYSTDCISDLPSLPEEIVQTPTKSEKHKDSNSDVFQDSEPGISKSLLQDELQKDKSELKPPCRGSVCCTVCGRVR
ncbi:hypothetical protein NL108_010626 [Boleophthalmus pectinirostris]|uniref:protein ELYS homolog n=1 Tax=Boleophthalmus pectinirostris TaxID=150288 RepID=UPI0024330B0F|nr:protein ELYS homolog [Boleophthalmus pectinirostris]KAJ0063013.1 hypothetical protein NL108_010626 [Boleophthalmus pectinirostris]